MATLSDLAQFWDECTLLTRKVSDDEKLSADADRFAEDEMLAEAMLIQKMREDGVTQIRGGVWSYRLVSGGAGPVVLERVPACLAEERDVYHAS